MLTDSYCFVRISIYNCEKTVDIWRRIDMIIFFYSIPILPIVVVILAVLNAGASWVRDVLPILSCLLIFKNVYIDLYYSIRKMSHNLGSAILQFLFGFVRIAVFSPILSKFLQNSGGIFGLLDMLLSIIFVIPIIAIFWLLGELSSLAYGLSKDNYSANTAIASNILSIIFRTMVSQRAN